VEDTQAFHFSRTSSTPRDLDLFHAGCPPRSRGGSAYGQSVMDAVNVTLPLPVS
jgi:hypothetical protein